MARPVHADGRQTRRAILDAALDLFAEKGYFGTSLRDIAGAVGVRESALYNYFQSKEALFNDLIATAQEDKAEQVVALLDQPVTDLHAVLEQLTHVLLDHFTAPRQQKLFRLLMSDGMRLAKEGRINLIEQMTSGPASLQELMNRLIANGGMRARQSELLIIEFMGPLLMWRHWHAVLPALQLVANRDAFVRDHVDHFLRGATTPAVHRVTAARTPRKRTTRRRSRAAS